VTHNQETIYGQKNEVLTYDTTTSNLDKCISHYFLTNKPGIHVQQLAPGKKRGGILDTAIIRKYCNFIFYHSAVKPGGTRFYQLMIDTTKLNEKGHPIIIPNLETTVHIHEGMLNSSYFSKIKQDYNYTLLDIKAGYNSMQAEFSRDAALNNESVGSAIKKFLSDKDKIIETQRRHTDKIVRLISKESNDSLELDKESIIMFLMLGDHENMLHNMIDEPSNI
jgi:hypothetical protein